MYNYDIQPQLRSCSNCNITMLHLINILLKFNFQLAFKLYHSNEERLHLWVYGHRIAKIYPKFSKNCYSIPRNENLGPMTSSINMVSSCFNRCADNFLLTDNGCFCQPRNLNLKLFPKCKSATCGNSADVCGSTINDMTVCMCSYSIRKYKILWKKPCSKPISCLSAVAEEPVAQRNTKTSCSLSLKVLCYKANALDTDIPSIEPCLPDSNGLSTPFVKPSTTPSFSDKFELQTTELTRNATTKTYATSKPTSRSLDLDETTHNSTISRGLANDDASSTKETEANGATASETTHETVTETTTVPAQEPTTLSSTVSTGAPKTSEYTTKVTQRSRTISTTVAVDSIQFANANIQIRSSKKEESASSSFVAFLTSTPGIVVVSVSCVALLVIPIVGAVVFVRRRKRRQMNMDPTVDWVVPNLDVDNTAAMQYAEMDSNTNRVEQTYIDNSSEF